MDKPTFERAATLKKQIEEIDKFLDTLKEAVGNDYARINIVVYADLSAALIEPLNIRKEMLESEFNAL